jgi:DNA-binding winged helix-turn-helix (wHTH) protein/tetratricopeptide (TPR) repeat protein
MASDTLFRFGRREIDAAARTVRLDGRLRPIEPRPFGLLVYLISHRRRVVTKEELLEALWPHEVVSISSLARAVMKARQAIADDDSPALIRSVPRIGYRFHGLLDHETGPVRSTLVPARAHDAQSIALLPFINDTGDSALDWTELGLMALAAQRLSLHPRLSPVDLRSLQVALEGARASGTDSAEAVRQATGATLVVRSRVAAARHGYRLDFDLDGTEASVFSEQPAELASRMAAALAERLFPDTAIPQAWQATASDPLAAESFARGMEAMARHQWAQAANLLSLALDLAPNDQPVQLELLRALSNTADHDTLRLSRRLLARAERGGDLLLASRVQQAVGRLHLHCRRFTRADFWLEQSVRLGEGLESPGGMARTLMLQASAAVHRGDHERATDTLQRMYRQCEIAGDRVLRVAGLNFEAIALSSRGELEQAVAASEEAMRRARDLHATSYLIDACDNAAWDLARLGRLQDALACGEEAVAASRALRSGRDPVESMPVVFWVHALSRSYEASAALAGELPPPGDVHSPEDAWCCRGLAATAAGHHAEAAECFSAALALHHGAEDAYRERRTLPWLIDALVLAGQHYRAARLLAAGPRHAKAQGDLSVQLLHSRALLEHALGASADALALLQELLAQRPPPLWAAWTCLDIAWLHAEAGRPEAGAPLLAQLPVALADHPLARAVRGRLQHAAGDTDGARLSLREALAALGSGAPDYLQALARQIEQGDTALPPAPCLASWL